MAFPGSKDIEILLLIAESSHSQRELARKTSFSLGIINTLLKRLIDNGYVQVHSLNKKNVEYRLTSLGELEAARYAHHRATDAIRRYQRISEDLTDLIQGLHRDGYEYFSIHGDGEIRELIEKTFWQSLPAGSATLGSEHRSGPRSVVLNATPLPVKLGGRVVSVVERLGRGNGRPRP